MTTSSTQTERPFKKGDLVILKTPEEVSQTKCLLFDNTMRIYTSLYGRDGAYKVYGKVYEIINPNGLYFQVRHQCRVISLPAAFLKKIKEN